MEIKFNETSCHCLRRAVDQQQIREQTQEVRLPDSMPDIGRVLGCWGQPLIRGKEWRSGSMSVSGGILAWVLYAPEDGSEPRSVESWIPFQLRWDFPETERDGAIWVEPCLRSMDARSTSARKLMLRANLSAWGRALEGVEVPLFGPTEVPEDIQLLTANYPMELPCEAGEKAWNIDEEIPLPDTVPAVEQMIRYELTLAVQEQRVMASRLVFRGKAALHLLYSSGGKLCTWDGEIPFSQYAELDRDYGPHASARITPVLTNLELETAEGRLQLKAGVAAQYEICDRIMVNVVEDAYSPVREVRAQQEALQLPMRLDETATELRAELMLRAEAGTVVDVCWMPDHPQRQQNGDQAELTVPGYVQVLYRDVEGALQSVSGRWEQKVQLGADSETTVDAAVRCVGSPRAVGLGQELQISMPLCLQLQISASGSQPMLTGLEAGEARQPDPGRPSMILRRCQEESLWAMAKSCGSTVEAIRRANNLQDEPESGRMLLIPVC